LTQLYAFFDGVPVSQYITPTGGVLGGDIITSAAGAVSGTFDIPAMSFNTGDIEFKLQDTETYETSTIPGSSVGHAESKFTAIGLQETYQTTINTINQTIVEVVEADTGGDGGGDPLAQSFFTYGVTGGCFITGVDIYFQSKDSAIPVTLELREMRTGMPSARRVSKYATVTLTPASVTTSSTASIATTFAFSRPIYLEENRDYCFVLLANSNKYNVWTSKLGEKSIENGKTIFEQPFVGSLFKSENNVTWTPEQTEDIKFTLYKAVFQTGMSEIEFKANAQPTLVYGSNFEVTSGSPVVLCKLGFQHSFRTGDKTTFTGTVGGNYRGISDAIFSDSNGYTVTAIDDYTFTFAVNASATSSGTLASSGILDRVDVDLVGSGYVSPSISFNGGGGSGAAATANVVGGKIVSVTITSPGSGYTSTPNLVLNDASGIGAVLTPISESIFSIPINRQYQHIVPVVKAEIVPNTIISNSVKGSDVDYVVGSYMDAPLNEPVYVDDRNVLVTDDVELSNFGATNSTTMITRLETTNANVSPLIDLGEVPAISFHNFIVNSSSNAASELTASAGLAQARYISKRVTVETLSKDIRVLVNAASIENTSFDVFIRTSISGSSVAHENLPWVALTCSTPTNTSSTWSEFKDYEFFTDAILPAFDVYDLKIVLYSENKSVFPRVNNYRAIVLAT
jgi:hypothetical protein